MPTVVCRLSVGEAKVSDTGSWICELSNAAGKSTSTCNVKVVGKSVRQIRRVFGDNKRIIFINSPYI